jgi:hypothetical protein
VGFSRQNVFNKFRKRQQERKAQKAQAEQAENDAAVEMELSKQDFVNAVALRPLKVLLPVKIQKRVRTVAKSAAETAQLIVEEQGEDLFLSLHAWVQRGTNTIIVTNTVEWPATWWEHLKQRLYAWRLWPDWIKGKWPVRMHVEKVPFEQNLYVCPHVSYPEGSTKHLRWMLDENGTLRLALRHLREIVLLDPVRPTIHDVEGAMEAAQRFLQRNQFLLDEMDRQ